MEIKFLTGKGSFNDLMKKLIIDILTIGLIITLKINTHIYFLF